MGESLTTTKHDEIKKWAEERGGRPSIVLNTEEYGPGAGLLRINFPGYSKKKSLREISWEDFFKTFDEQNLAFLYQNETKNGQLSRFFKFIARKSA